MANARIEFLSDYSTVRCLVEGLTYGSQNYDEFHFRLYKWNGSSWVSQGTQTVSKPDARFNTNNWMYHDFSGMEPNAYYYMRGWAKYSGTWYPDDPSVGYGYITDGSDLMPAIPTATFSNASTQKTTIQFDYTNSVGSMSLYVWNGSSWNTVANSGLPYSKSGNTITFTNLIPNTSYYFYVRTYVGSYYSVAPSSSPYYQTYTTQSWPTIGTAVSLNTSLGTSGRYNGGLYLSWGDNGFEGSGFSYGLKVDGSTSAYYYYTDNSGSNNYYTSNDYGVQHYFQVTVGYYGYGVNGSYEWYVDTNNFTSATYIYTCPAYPTGITVGTVTTNSIAVTATGMVANYTAVEWRWRVYNSGSGFSTYTDYGGGLSAVISSLSVNTAYEIRCYGYHSTSGLYSASYQVISQYTNNYPRLALPTLTASSSTTKSISFTMATVTGSTSYTCDLYLNGNLQDTFTGFFPQDGMFDNLVHGTGYVLYLTVSGSGYLDNTNSINISTSTLTVGYPMNATVTQNPNSHTVDVKYSWGTNATGMDFAWSNDESTWTYFYNQSNNNYPSMNYTVDVVAYGNKYFQIRSRRTDGYNTVYSSWYTFLPYPINVVNNPRPSNFNYISTIVQGGNIYQTDLVNKILYILRADEWNNLTTKINEFRVYKGLSSYSFTNVSSGTTITKEIINEAINAINDLTTRTINPPALRVTGDKINEASLYLGIKNALNSVP